MNQTVEKLLEINNHLGQLKTSIDVVINQNNEYIKYFKRYSNKNFTIETKEGETLEQQKDKAETILDQLKDINVRNKLEIQNFENCQEKINQIKQSIDELKNKFVEEKEKYERKTEDVTKQTIEIVKHMKEREIKRIDDERNKIEKDFDKMLIQYTIEDSEEEIKSKLNGIIDENEMNQLEQWTNKKCSEVLFDSNKDNWSQNTSVFDSKIMNKSYMAFIVEDHDNNKFGYFLNGTANTNESWIKTQGSFNFSLKSNGRINSMMKFEEGSGCSGSFLSYNKSNVYLLSICSSFYIYKENNKQNSNCSTLGCFNCHGITNPLRGTTDKFSPKRITVIQMK